MLPDCASFSDPVPSLGISSRVGVAVDSAAAPLTVVSRVGTRVGGTDAIGLPFARLVAVAVGRPAVPEEVGVFIAES